MSKRDEQHRSAKDVPPVGRPRGAVWRSLQADGVVWEGQVLLVGDDVDLAARMIVTHRRVAFVRGNEVVLEIPRGWLRQEPVLRRDGVLELFVATPDSNLFDEPQRVPLRMREGHPAAGHIIAMLAPGGVRRIEPDALSALERARESAASPRYNGFWDGIEPVAGADSRNLLESADDRPNGRAKAEGSLDGRPPIEPPDRVLRVPSTQPPPRQAVNGSAFPIAGIAPRDQRRSPWLLLLRLCALTVLLATAAALGAGRLNIHLPGMVHRPILAAPTPTAAATSTDSAAEPAKAAMAPADLTAVALGVGGPGEETAGAQSDETSLLQAATPSPVMEAGSGVAEATIPAPAAASTPAATSTPEPTTAATTAAAAAPLATPSQSTAPATPPAASTPLSAAAIQPAAFGADETPAQEIIVGPLRVAIASAQRAETLPRYGLPPGSGDWILLMTEITNDGDAAASLPMSDFRLFDRGTGVTANLDSGMSVIASLAGFDPARGPSDTIALDPGQSTRALLLFLLPPGGSDDLALIVGPEAMDLAPSLAQVDATVAAQPELVQATVKRVENGSRITVEIDGAEQAVRYLGIVAPDATACYAAESATANAQLVDGKQVWLEREASDRAADGALLRDVWVAGPDGNRMLVAAQLLETGSSTVNAAPPDTRYQAWLSASQALGRTNGAGLWSACPAS
jgi:endonuclease YncB( thermonuclease family)